MEDVKMVYDKLDELGISVETVDHPPALTTEQADEFIEGVAGVRTKTMFLTNRKKKNFYLVIMDDTKLLDMDNFKEIVGEKVKMASAETLMQKMKLAPGVVSLFGLLNNEDKDIKVYFDKAIMGEERMSFHPNTNEKTVFIDIDDMLKFMDAIGYEANVVEL